MVFELLGDGANGCAEVLVVIERGGVVAREDGGADVFRCFVHRGR